MEKRITYNVVIEETVAVTDGVSFGIGDYIIATKRHPTTGDRSFISEPIKVVDITDGHIVYEWQCVCLKGSRSAMPIVEVIERGFVVASESIINTIK
jgi:hypothetical protein